MRQIFELYETGQYSLRSLSQELTRRGYTSLQGNAFNTSTIGHIPQNPKYKGWHCGNKTQSLDYRKKKTVFLDESEWVSYPDPISQPLFRRRYTTVYQTAGLLPPKCMMWLSDYTRNEKSRRLLTATLLVQC